MKKPFNILALVAFTVFLSGGCGGGGSDSGGNGSNTQSDNTPPSILTTSPSNGAINVAVNTSIRAVSSEPLDASTITTASFTLSSGATGSVTYNDFIVTFKPDNNLAYSTQYTAVVKTVIKDTAGNALASDYTWSFTTGSAASSVPSAPIEVSASANNEQITISWQAVSVADSYNIYMASRSGVMKDNFAGLADGMNHMGVTSPYVHTDLVSGKTYYFVVTAINSFGESSESNQVSAVLDPGTMPPPTPVY